MEASEIVEGVRAHREVIDPSSENSDTFNNFQQHEGKMPSEEEDEKLLKASTLTRKVFLTSLPPHWPSPSN